MESRNLHHWVDSATPFGGKIGKVWTLLADE
jgi:hypothetical protein